jgi:uncharacterized membrane protein YdjX (TVP38/TMEM64 family)
MTAGGGEIPASSGKTGSSTEEAKTPPRRELRFALKAWGAWLVLVAGGTWAFWSWYCGGVAFELLRTDLDAATQIERLRAAFAAMGLWAPVAYVGLVTTECVVAPIPGLLLYAPGGMIFGPWLGGALSLTGNVLGAGLASTAARCAGEPWREKILSGTTQVRLHCELERRGAWWVFWLRVNPLTSSDLVSYAAGLAGVRPGRVMVATACGMAPLCFVQSAVSHELFQAVPGLVYPLVGLCLVYLVAAVYFVRRAMVGAAG